MSKEEIISEIAQLLAEESADFGEFILAYIKCMLEE